MKIEWNPDKNQSNRQKHMLDFEDAQEVLGETHLVFPDTRQDYGEDRFIAIGTLRGRMVVLVYTKRNDVYRIISMRKANEREQEKHKDRLESAR